MTMVTNSKTYNFSLESFFIGKWNIDPDIPCIPAYQLHKASRNTITTVRILQEAALQSFKIHENSTNTDNNVPKASSGQVTDVQKGKNEDLAINIPEQQRKTRGIHGRENTGIAERLPVRRGAVGAAKIFCEISNITLNQSKKCVQRTRRTRISSNSTAKQVEADKNKANESIRAEQQDGIRKGTRANKNKQKDALDLPEDGQPKKSARGKKRDNPEKGSNDYTINKKVADPLEKVTSSSGRNDTATGDEKQNAFIRERKRSKNMNDSKQKETSVAVKSPKLVPVRKSTRKRKQRYQILNGTISKFDNSCLAELSQKEKLVNKGKPNTGEPQEVSIKRKGRGERGNGGKHAEALELNREIDNEQEVNIRGKSKRRKVSDCKHLGQEQVMEPAEKIDVEQNVSTTGRTKDNKANESSQKEKLGPTEKILGKKQGVGIKEKSRGRNLSENNQKTLKCTEKTLGEEQAVNVKKKKKSKKMSENNQKEMLKPTEKTLGEEQGVSIKKKNKEKEVTESDGRETESSVKSPEVVPVRKSTREKKQKFLSDRSYEYDNSVMLASSRKSCAGRKKVSKTNEEKLHTDDVDCNKLDSKGGRASKKPKDAVKENNSSKSQKHKTKEKNAKEIQPKDDPTSEDCKITAKKGTLKYLQQREKYIEALAREAQVGDDFFSDSTAFSKKKTGVNMLLLPPLHEESLAIRTPKRGRDQPDAAVTPRTAMLGALGCITPTTRPTTASTRPITPSTRPTTPSSSFSIPSIDSDDKKHALQVMFHMMQGKGKKGRPKNAKKVPQGANGCLSSRQNKNFKFASIELPTFSEPENPNECDTSRDDYFSDNDVPL